MCIYCVFITLRYGENSANAIIQNLLYFHAPDETPSGLELLHGDMNGRPDVLPPPAVVPPVVGVPGDDGPDPQGFVSVVLGPNSSRKGYDLYVQEEKAYSANN